MKKFLITILVLLAIFSAGDYLARGYAEGEAADELQQRLELSSKPSVGLGGWPFVLAALRGEFPSIGIDAERVEMKGLEFSDVNLELEDLTFSMRDALRGGVSEVTAQGGVGEARLDQDSVDVALEKAGAPFGVSLQEGSAVAELPNGEKVDVEVGVSGGALTFAPQGRADEVRIPLPGIVDNLTYRSAEIEDGSVTVRLRLGPTLLQREI